MLGYSERPPNQEFWTHEYINNDKNFLTIKNTDDLKVLLSRMTEGALLKADQKIGVLKKIEEFESKQSSLFAKQAESNM